ncbi:MAG: 16S rRNA (guanine(527)-N(7))-methyltransferase RsmG [Phycisphaerales bacterium]
MPVDPLIPPEEFHTRLGAMGVELEPGDAERLGRFLALLLEANQSFNLTAITDPASAWIRHVLDSLTLLPMLSAMEPREPGKALSVIDVGSGGGLPGIPLAITMPGADFTLVDATGKKAAYLRRVAGELALKNVTVVHDRAERVGTNPAHRGKHDVAMARAVGALPVLAELVLPLVRVGGVALAIKGAKAEEELAAAVKARGRSGASTSRRSRRRRGGWW